MINDLGNIKLNCKLFIYADDITLLISHKDPSQAISQISNDLIKICQYTEQNKLILNANKTKAMYFNTTSSVPIYIGTESIEIVQKFKFLGYIIDNKLKYEDQLNLVANRLSSTAAKIRRCRSFLDSHTLKLLFNCIGLPYILYSASIILNCNRTHFNRLKSKYNECFRCMLYTFAWSGIRTSDILHKLQVPNLENVITRHVLNIIFKIMLHKQPTNLYAVFHSLNARTYNFYVHRTLKSCTKKISFKYYGPYIWSLIPKHTKQTFFSSEAIYIDDVDLGNIFITYVSYNIYM